MSRSTKSLKDATQLLELSDLFSTNIQTVIQEWAKEQEPDANNDGASPDMLPSLRLYEAQRILLALTGKLTELVAEPSLRIMEVGCQYWESRALYIACERRIPDMLAAPADIKNGVSIKTLGAKTGIEADKLSRILRTLCSNHIFAEPSPDHFTNNVISAALVGNEPLRAYILNFNLDLYAASEHLPKALLDKVKGPSYQVDETAWQDALGTTMSRWDWLEEKVTPDQISKPGVGYPSVPQPSTVIKGDMKTVGEPLVGRPEHQIFNLSMLGGGRVHGAAHPYDYPWASLGSGAVVDVGGGFGGFLIQLSHLYPSLNLILQDRGPVLQIAQKEVWPRENPTALESKRVQFVQHDFFEPNPVHGAEVYWLRSILHDWSDTYCVQILSALAGAMVPHSRILICDQLMTPTTRPSSTPSSRKAQQAAQLITPAPSPLPANYGTAVRFSHQRDLCMMGIINGIERTPAQLQKIVESAGLVVEKVWECRAQVPIVVVKLKETGVNRGTGQDLSQSDGLNGMGSNGTSADQ
ncbi:MAG: hypothetical protein Q9205_003915 [Flavoplaca limonia]